MKRLILVFIVASFLFSCGTKQAEQPSAPKETLTLSELKAKYGIDLMGEEPTAKGGGKGSSSATVATVTTDLTLTVSGTDYTTTLPTDATFGGLQKATVADFSDLASACNWYVAGQSLTSKTCSDVSGATWHRSWSSDGAFNVHLSAFINQ